ADYLQRGGIRTNVDLKYFVHAPVIFGVPFFARECAKVAARYGVNVHYQHNLVAVDAKAKTALFEPPGCRPPDSHSRPRRRWTVRPCCSRDRTSGQGALA